MVSKVNEVVKVIEAKLVKLAMPGIKVFRDRKASLAKMESKDYLAKMAIVVNKDLLVVLVMQLNLVILVQVAREENLVKRANRDLLDHPAILVNLGSLVIKAIVDHAVNPDDKQDKLIRVDQVKWAKLVSKVELVLLVNQDVLGQRANKAFQVRLELLAYLVSSVIVVEKVNPEDRERKAFKVSVDHLEKWDPLVYLDLKVKKESLE